MSEVFPNKKCRKHGNSLEVQWLRLCVPMQGAQVQSLVRELRSHTHHMVQPKKEKRLARVP